MDSTDLPPLPAIEGTEFRHCPGYPGYCVGSDGSVYSSRRLASLGVGGGKGTRTIFGSEWKRKAITGHGNGYLKVTLIGERRLVHHVVLEAFIGPCPAGQECRHLDGNPANDRLDNLTWGTRKENAEDRAKHGTKLLGEHHPNSKLTESQVLEIRKLSSVGVSCASIGRRFRINQATAWQVANRKTWVHVP